MHSRLALLVLLASLPAVTGTCAHCTFVGPASPAAQPAWLAGLNQERDTVRSTINYTGGVFSNPAMQWTQQSYIQPQSHPYDRFFYDPVKGEYTIDRFLDDLKARYGGIDAVLMWPTYTNIGSDDRNQFDYFRSMPGGLAGVKNATAQLEARGVRVLWPYNPWDTGTRREPLSDEDTFAKLLKETGGDGFNGDTMGFVQKSFWDASTKVGHPLAFEPEGGGEDASLNWDTMGWGYYSYPKAPLVDRFKYITRGKWMTNVCNRWAQSKTNDLQSAWFNGAGYESWENVWGTWNGITPRDGEAIRRVAAMLRFFGGKTTGNEVDDFLHSPDWEPHAPRALQSGVYIGKFPGASNTSAAGDTLYTLVNREGQNQTGGQTMFFPNASIEPDTRVFDCYNGKELTFESAEPQPTPGSIPKSYNLYSGSNAYEPET